jgi:hypothetical protein
LSSFFSLSLSLSLIFIHTLNTRILSVLSFSHSHTPLILNLNVESWNVLLIEIWISSSGVGWQRRDVSYRDFRATNLCISQWRDSRSKRPPLTLLWLLDVFQKSILLFSLKHTKHKTHTLNTHTHKHTKHTLNTH